MKVLKTLLIILASVVGLFLVVTLLLPSKYTVSRSISINAPASVVFDQVNTIKNWEKWSPWYQMDPKQKISYSGPDCGSGACYAWESTNSDLGIGKLTITESQPYDYINTKVIFAGSDMGDNPWTFKEENGVTTVTQSIKSEFDFFGRWMGLMLDAGIGPMFEKSLANLKTVSEAAPKLNVKINITDVEPQTVLAVNQATSTDSKEIGAALGSAFGEIMEFMKKNKLEMAGPPLSINNSYADGKIDFDAGIPIRTTNIATSGRIKLLTTTAGKVVKAVAVGPYEQSEKYYKAVDEYIKKNNLKVRGKSWEVYISDPADTPPDKIVTYIYFPIYVPE